MDENVDRPVSLDLTAEELELVEAGLRLLLAAEDDHDTIVELKDLLQRVNPAAHRPAATLRPGTAAPVRETTAR